MASALSLQLSFTLEECKDYSPHIMFDSACIQFLFAFRMISLSTDTSATSAKHGLPRWFGGKESSCQCRRHGFDLGVGKIPWKRKWQSTPVFLPGESHGQRSLAGYSPRGHKSWTRLSDQTTTTTTTTTLEGLTLRSHINLVYNFF